MLAASADSSCLSLSHHWIHCPSYEWRSPADGVDWLYRHIAWADTLTIHYPSLQLNHLPTDYTCYTWPSCCALGSGFARLQRMWYTSRWCSYDVTISGCVNLWDHMACHKFTCTAWNDHVIIVSFWMCVTPPVQPRSTDHLSVSLLIFVSLLSFLHVN